MALDDAGKLTAMGHDAIVSNLPGEGFSEPCALATHFLYGGDNRSYKHEIARVHQGLAGSMRAPGEAVGMLALENAMDELAHAAGIDPVQLRLNNIPEVHPENGKEYSSRRFADCLTQGAERFGWSKRNAKPGQTRDGEWLIGYGMSSAARTNILGASEARVILHKDATATVETDMTDIGTGTYTILGQIAAELLGLDVKNVTVKLGDTDLARSEGLRSDCVSLNMVLHHNPTPADIISDCANLLSGGGVLLITDLCAHDQDWVKKACGDLWLGFEPQELTRWATAAGLEEGNSLYLAQRNGFRIQLRQFIKPAVNI